MTNKKSHLLGQGRWQWREWLGLAGELVTDASLFEAFVEGFVRILDVQLNAHSGEAAPYGFAEFRNLRTG